MGWTFLHNTPDKRQVVEMCTRDSDTLKCVKKAVHGNHLWTVWQDSVTKNKTIVLFLLGKDRGDWGYKDITEGMGPVEVDCPLSFLDFVPEPTDSPYAKGWREKVRKYHEQEKTRRGALKALEIGKMVRLKDSNPSEFRIVSLDPLRGTASTGHTYKIPKTRVVEVF